MRRYINLLEEDTFDMVPVEFKYAPVMSKDTFDMHYHELYRGYVKRANAGETSDFVIGGAELHEIYFSGLKSPDEDNKPHGRSLRLIKEKFGSFSKFKKSFAEVCLNIQGSAWVHLGIDGEIKTIKDHKPTKNIALIIDMWEHAYVLDYGTDRHTYVNNFWRIVDWEVVNIRLS